MDKEMKEKIEKLIDTTSSGKVTWKQGSENTYYITNGSEYSDNQVQISIQEVHSILSLAAQVLSATKGSNETAKESYNFIVKNPKTNEVIFRSFHGKDNEYGQSLYRLYLAAYASTKRAAINAIDQFL